MNIASPSAESRSGTTLMATLRSRCSSSAPCNYDRHHVLVHHGIYEIPLLKKSRSPSGQLFSGWTVSFVSQFQTGTPFSISTADDFAGVGPGSGGQFWVINGDPTLPRDPKKFSDSTSDANFWFKPKKDDGSAMLTAPTAGTFSMQKVQSKSSERNLQFALRYFFCGSRGGAFGNE